VVATRFVDDIEADQGNLASGGLQHALLKIELGLSAHSLDAAVEAVAGFQIPIAEIGNPIGQAQVFPGKHEVLRIRLLGQCEIGSGIQGVHKVLRLSGPIASSGARGLVG